MSKKSYKVLGVIPARYNSSRFPGKPLQNILGKSLLQRTFENASLSKRIDHLLIATDDLRIFEHAKGFGADVVMTQEDCPTGTDRIAQAIHNRFQDYPIVVNIQGDEPCLKPQIIDQLVELLENESSVMTTPVAKLNKVEDILNPSVVKCVFDNSFKALYFSRAPIPYPKAFSQRGELVSQDERDAIFRRHEYYRHLGIYAFRREFLLNYAHLFKTPLQQCEDLEQLKILEHGYSIHVAVVEDEALGVDRPEDIKKIEDILLCNQSNQNTYSLPVV